MRRYLSTATMWVSVLVLLTLASCFTDPVIYTVSDPALPLATPVGTDPQTILEAAQTQDMQNAADLAVAAAERMVDNAQATMNFATQTQATVATLQRYAEQDRQGEEQKLGSIAFLRQ